MRRETRCILSSPDLLKAREVHFARLENLYAGRPGDYAFVLNGVLGQSHAEPYREPERWLDESLDHLAEHADRLCDPHVFRPLVIEYGPYGVHFVDRMFGVRVYHADGQWWSDYLRTPVGSLEPPDLERDETWRLARRVAEAFAARQVNVPLFGLPTLSSALNVALNLYGQEFLVAMHIDPEAAHRDLGVINDLLCDLHRWYLETLPGDQVQPVVAAWRCQPRGHGQLCGCSCHLVSADMYREFIAPRDEALLSVYPNGGMIHLCGEHRQHIPVWREMPSLRAIQVNDRASEDLAIYFDELRDDQILYLNPTPTMTVERAMDITGGHRIVLVAEVPEPIPVRR